MLNCFITQPGNDLVPIMPVLKSTFESWVSSQSSFIRQWVQANRFIADAGSFCFVPNNEGKLAMVLVGIANADDFWVFGDLPGKLPSGQYRIDVPEPEPRIIMAWGLGSYIFNRYQQKYRVLKDLGKPQLWVPESANPKFCNNMVTSICWVRDLINTPTEDMSPAMLADIALTLTQEYPATATIIRGEELLSANYPLVYAVGRGSSRPPCLVDLRWGEPQAPMLTLVGKGICFDSGGMNLKSPDGMRLMKKDMGGAAHVLGLARLIMAQKLPVRLRAILPMAENMVAGNNYRPGDVFRTRSGITVEISNTDAEGRLILGDALAAAAEEKPDLIIDFSTLTGAARVAVGPDVASFFANQEKLAEDLILAADRARDPVWRLPLHQPYERYLKSEIADICNASNGPYAGAITAALYLKQFIPATIPWAHFDVSGWNFDRLSGRPVGGEANGFRAVYAFLQNRYLK